MKFLAQIFYFVLGFGLVISIFAGVAFFLDWAGLLPHLDPKWIGQYPILNYILLIIVIGGSAVFQFFGHALGPKFRVGKQFENYKLPAIAGASAAGILTLILFLISI